VSAPVAAARPRRDAAFARALILATVLLLTYVVLGALVSHAPPSAFDLAGETFVGAAEPLAIVLTQSCLWYVLLPLGIAAIVFGVLVPAWRLRAFASVALTVVMWLVSNVLKDAFGRPRPEHWVWVHESSFSYSSGHAMFATIVYGLWAWYVYRSALPAPARVGGALALLAWACGIVWSRMALGAHYPTDLIGGVLLGGFGITVAFAATRLVHALR
jgi:undecaprenyl-diphosphatase